MKKTSIFITTLLLYAYSFAQVTTLTFTGSDGNGGYIRVDSVVITNLTKNWQETIYYPDTILIMNASSGIKDTENSTYFSLFRNVPNPFAGISEFSLQLTVAQKVTILVFDTKGKRITEMEKSLLPGEHTFRLLLSTPQTYLLHAHAGTESASLTIINTGNAGTNRIEYLQNSHSILSNPKIKNNKGVTTNPFNVGDEMKYVGFATINNTKVESQHIEQQQMVSENFELIFTYTILELPTVITSTISSITENSAVSGGEVISDGNATISARGICWNTTTTPTITDDHTTNGSGLGIFTSNITGLTSNTTYYVRAYATNSQGTAYGQTISFTTLINETPPTLCSEGVTDIDGNFYNGIEIGNQCWMKENLRVTHYANGDILPLGEAYTYTYDTAYYYYPEYDDPYTISMFGLFYNWEAVMHGASASNTNPSGIQGICPDGWHVPSDAEFLQLIEYVKTQSNYLCNGNLLYIAKALASTNGWSISSANTCAVANDPGANNATGFSGMPAGFYNGGYGGFQQNANIWTTSEYNDLTAYYRYLSHNGTQFYREIYDKFFGASVRCVKD